MIATWMAYAVVVGALLSLVGVGAELILRRWTTNGRVAWLVALAASVILPLLTLIPELVVPDAGLDLPSFRRPQRLPETTIGGVSPSLLRRLDGLDASLIVLWFLGTTTLSASYVISRLRLRRMRGDWERTTLAGVEVRLSTDTGPAVVGLRSPTIVVPRWMLDLERSMLDVVLAHEREHVRMRDPLALFAGYAAVVLLPWNVALWWQWRRLRLAVEVDCDARVLAVERDVRRYGALLLAVGQRARPLAPLVAAVSESARQLERRIVAMTANRLRHRVAYSLAGAALALTALIVACQVENPATPAVGEQKPQPTMVPANTDFFEFQVEDPVTLAAGSRVPRYPDILRQAGVEGEVLAQFVVDTTGLANVASFKTLRSTHDLFAQAVRAALPEMRFTPALVGGRKVKQLVQMPFTFAVNR
jgi:TonB family protein